MKLTQSALDKLDTTTGERILFDDGLPGFGVRITAAGSKIFIAQGRLAGRPVRISLGKADAISVADARREARRVLGQIADGTDPRRQARAVRQSKVIFADFAERFVKERIDGRRATTTARDYRLLLRKHINPLFGTVPLSDVAFSDLQKLHQKMRATPTQANRAVGVVRGVITYAEKLQLRPQGTNPGYKFDLNPEKARERFLSDEEAVRVADALDELDGNGLTPWTAAAIRLLMLTGARSSEIRAMKWEHIDRDRGLAILPTSKNGAKRTIYLAPPAMQVIDRLPQRGAYVIAGLSIDKACGPLTAPWAKVRKQAGLEDVRLHDLRHTFASAALADGLPLAVVGRILGHKTMQATARYAHLANDPVAQAAQEVSSKIGRTMRGEALATGNIERVSRNQRQASDRR